MAKQKVKDVDHTPLLGHEALRGSLKESIRAGRAAHAYLVSGARGVGKTGIALEMARLLLCEQSLPFPCNECSQRASSQKLEPPDLHLVFPLPSKKRSDEHETDIIDRNAGQIHQLTQNLAADPYQSSFLPRSKREESGSRTSEDKIRIGLVRSIIRQASLKPYQASRTVFIVFHADTMNDQAQNGLLKLLEEPPAESYIFLIAENEREMLATIRSRCRRIAVPPIETGVLSDWLITQGIAAADARALAVTASGSMARVRELRSGDFAGHQALTIDFLRSAVLCDPEKIARASDALLNSKEYSVDVGLDLLATLLRDAATLRALPAEQAGSLTFSKFIDQLRRIIGSYPAANWEAACGAVDESIRHLARAYSADFVFYSLALRLNELMGPRAVSKPTVAA